MTTYVTFENQYKIKSEADLLAFIDKVVGDLQSEFPSIDDPFWRMRAAINAMINPEMAGEWLAVELINRARYMRESIEERKPAWEVAHRSLALQEQLMLYRLPDMRTMAGKIESRRKQPRTSNDALTLRVLRELRHKKGFKWRQAVTEMRRAADQSYEIAGVEIDYDESDTKYTFRTRDGQETYKESTLRRHKWEKLKQTDTP